MFGRPCVACSLGSSSLPRAALAGSSGATEQRRRIPRREVCEFRVVTTGEPPKNNFGVSFRVEEPAVLSGFTCMRKLFFGGSWVGILTNSATSFRPVVLWQVGNLPHATSGPPCCRPAAAQDGGFQAR